VSPDQSRYKTPPEIATRFGCKPETVIAWIRNGELAAINLARRGSLRPRYRVSPEALAAFEQARSVVPRTPPVRRKPSRKLPIKRFV
jgi:hypothetical protein